MPIASLTPRVAALAGAFVLAAATALAQAPGAPAPPAESPERTTAQFGDWGMQCVPRPAPAPGAAAPPPNQASARLCEILQIVQNQQQQPVSVLAIGRNLRTDPLKLVARLPASVLVNTPVRMVFEGNEAPLTLPFRHCLPNPPSCFAEIELRDDSLMRRLRTRTTEQGARLEWRDPAGNQLQVPVSFRGFAAAMDALQKEGG